MHKIWPVFLIAVPILLMVGLIPVIKNDYFLTVIYVVFIVGALYFKRAPNDLTVLLFGFVAMTIFESVFIKTGVETFSRHSLFGLMPLWLPFLWGYGFVAIKRALEIFQR